MNLHRSYSKMAKLLLTLSVVAMSIFTSNAQFNQFVESDIHVKQGNYNAAISALNNYIELDPANAEAYIKRALVYEMLAQPVERDKDLALARHLNPFANMYISMSSRFRYFEKKQYGYDFNSELASFSKSPVQGNYYNDYIEKVIDLHSQDSMLMEAIHALSINDIKTTEQILLELDESESTSGIVYDIKGLIALKENNLKESIDYFTKSIKLMPDFPLAYHNRAVAYKLLGDLENAEKDLTTAISLNEDISVFYFTLAKLNEHLGKPDLTSANYSKALDKNPDYLEARHNYSLLQKTLGNYESALSDLNLTGSNNKVGKENHFLKGGLALTYGEYEKAIKEFDNYLDYYEDDCNAIFNRGLAKILLGTKEEGCIDIAESIEIEPKKDREEIYLAFCNNL